MKLDLKKVFPYITAILTFLLVTIIYFSPAVFDGKGLRQSDIQQFKGMSKEIADHRDATGEEPLWTNSMFSGMPAYQISVKHPNNLMTKVHKIVRLGLPRPADTVFLYMLGFFVLLICLKVDPWLAIVGSIAFGLSSYFFVILEAGHNSKANAIAYVAPTIGAFYLLYRRNILVGGALLAFFFALEIAMNHVQVTYYMGFILVFFVIAEFIRSLGNGQVVDMLKRSGIGLVAVALAVMCNASNLMTTKEYGEFTTRGKSELTIKEDGTANDDIKTSGLDRDYVTAWSYGKQESLTLLIPNAKGGETSAIGADNSALSAANAQFRQTIAGQNHYWGDQTFTSGPHYVGAVIFLLFILAISYSDKRAMYWMIAALPLLFILSAITSPIIAGVLVLTYILAGAFLNKDVLQYSLFSALVLTLILSWGKNYMPFTDLFLDYIPGYNKFRAVTIILVIVDLCIPLIAVLFVARLIKEKEHIAAQMKPFLAGTGVLVLFLLVAIISPDGILGLDFFSDAEKASFAQQMQGSPEQAGQIQMFIDNFKDVRISIFRSDAIRSLVLVGFGALAVFLFLKDKAGKYVMIGALGLLIVIDQVSVDKRYINNEKQQGRYISWTEKRSTKEPFTPTQADKAILQSESSPKVQAGIDAAMSRLMARKQKAKGLEKRVTDQDKQIAQFSGLNSSSNYRVLDLSNPFNEARTSYFHKSIGGYHGAKMKRYQELANFYILPARNRIVAELQAEPSVEGLNALLKKEVVLNMLNAKYIVYNAGAAPMTNINALGNAWVVDEIRMVKNADEEILALKDIDPLNTAVVDERYASMLPGDLNPDPSAIVQLRSYAPNSLIYDHSSNGKSVVVFSEIFYDNDWQAYIDGMPVDHFRVNYVLRGMVVPAGDHEIEFRIEAKTYTLGSTLSLVGSILILLLLAGVGYKGWKDKKNGSEDTDEVTTT